MIRNFIGDVAWKIFLWARGRTEDEYWAEVAHEIINIIKANPRVASVIASWQETQK